jgi:hypothetical protein
MTKLRYYSLTIVFCIIAFSLTACESESQKPFVAVDSSSISETVFSEAEISDITETMPKQTTSEIVSETISEEKEKAIEEAIAFYKESLKGSVQAPYFIGAKVHKFFAYPDYSHIEISLYVTFVGEYSHMSSPAFGVPELVYSDGTWQFKDYT